MASDTAGRGVEKNPAQPRFAKRFRRCAGLSRTALLERLPFGSQSEGGIGKHRLTGFDLVSEKGDP